MSTQQKYIDIKEQRGQYWLENIMKDKFAVSMFGQKRLSREGGIEIVVKELCTRMARDGYINRETDFFPYKMLIYLPFDLFESQIIAKYLVLLRKTEYHVNVGHKIRGLYYLFRLKKKQCKYGVHIPINVFGIGLVEFFNNKIKEYCDYLPDFAIEL